MSTDNAHYVGLWTYQSQLFWQTVYQVPVIAGGMFAGWFALKSASQDELARWLLVVGLLSMVVQMLILHRMSQHLNTFRQAADMQIPRVSNGLVRLSGYQLGIAVPVLVGLFFAALFFLSPEFKKGDPAPPAAASTPAASR